MRSRCMVMVLLLATCGDGRRSPPAPIDVPFAFDAAAVDAVVTDAPITDADADADAAVADASPPDAIATSGSIRITVRCSGVGCQTGDLRILIYDCTTGAHVVADLLLNVTLVSGAGLEDTFMGLAPAPDCALAYLDEDGNGAVNGGDIVATAAPPHVTVVAGQEVQATITLNAIKPCPVPCP